MVSTLYICKCRIYTLHDPILYICMYFNRLTVLSNELNFFSNSLIFTIFLMNVINKFAACQKEF